MVARLERNRELARRPRDGDSVAARIMLARRAGSASAELQRELAWPNQEGMGCAAASLVQSQAQGAGVRPGEPCSVVIFGAAGDLTKRLLVPSLYNLRSSNLLPQNFAVVGVSADKFSDEEFRQKLTRDIHEFAGSPVDKELWGWFTPRIY